MYEKYAALEQLNMTDKKHHVKQCSSILNASVTIYITYITILKDW